MLTPDDPSLSDHDLLRAYAQDGSQIAFRQIVERHVGLVTGVVRRQVQDAGAAEEAVQNVFAILARKATSARARPTLGGWLCRTALFESRRAQRRAAQSIRHLHALMNHSLSNPTDAPDPRWSEALPHLDQALAELNPADRDLLLLRFHERKSFQIIGHTIGKSADASQKQAERALDKLGKLLRRKGVALGVAALALGLSGSLSEKRPVAQLSSSQLARQAVASAPCLSRFTLIHHTIETMNYPKTTTFFATVLLALIPLVTLWRENSSLRQEMASTAAPIAHVSSSNQLTSISSRPSRFGQNSKATAQAPGPIDWNIWQQQTDPVQRSTTFHQFLATLTPESASNASTALAELRNRDKLTPEEWKLFLRAWGGVDGGATMAYLASLPPNVGARSGGENEAALAGWAGHDSSAAQAWIAQQLSAPPVNDGELQPYRMEELINAVSVGMRVNHSNAARDYLIAQAVAGNVNPSRAAHWAVGDINADPPGTAAALLERLSRDPSHDEIRLAILDTTLANRRTDESIQLANQWQQYLQPESLKYAVGYLDGPEAMRWLDSLSQVSNDKKPDARASIISSWAQTDPDAAGAWLSEPNRRTDLSYPAAAAAYAKAVVGYDPAAAIAWAQTLPDPTAQHDTFIEMARNSLSRNDQEAVAMFKALGLTDEELKLLAQPMTWERPPVLRLHATVDLDRSNSFYYGTTNFNGGTILLGEDQSQTPAIQRRPIMPPPASAGQR